VTIVAQWRKQIPENWQAARDFLARRFPEHWAPKEHGQILKLKRGPTWSHRGALGSHMSNPPVYRPGCILAGWSWVGEERVPAS